GGGRVGALVAGGGQRAVALGVRDHREDRQRRVGGGLLGGPVGEVVHLVQRVRPGLDAVLGEPGDHQVVCVVVVGVAGADLLEDADHVPLGAQVALQHQQPEPRGGVGGRQSGGRSEEHTSEL